MPIVVQVQVVLGTPERGGLERPTLTGACGVGVTMLLAPILVTMMVEPVGTGAGFGRFCRAGCRA